VGGPLILEKYVKTMEGYDEDDLSKMTVLVKEASERLLAYLYLENSDQDKYGSILRNLNSQKSLGNDQYPKTIVETNNVLSSDAFDANKIKKQDQNHQNQKQANKNKIKESKEDEESTLLSFGQMEGSCYCCGRAGHKSPDC
jgi:hypothetical protein